MENIEIKTPLADRAATEARVRAMGAAFAWSRRQRDVFFRVPSGYLKLRTDESGAAELIAYVRAAGADPRSSDYDIAPVADPAALEAVLRRSLGVRGVVEKTRRLFLWRHTRIHLDEVAGLGAFLELETVVGGGAAAVGMEEPVASPEGGASPIVRISSPRGGVEAFTRAEAEAETRAVIAALDLDPARFLDRPYLELLEAL